MSHLIWLLKKKNIEDKTELLKEIIEDIDGQKKTFLEKEQKRNEERYFLNEQRFQDNYYIAFDIETMNIEISDSINIPEFDLLGELSIEE